MSNTLVEMVRGLGHPRLLVIGDAILDRYIWGTPNASARRRLSFCSVPTTTRSAWGGPPTSPTWCAAWKRT